MQVNGTAARLPHHGDATVATKDTNDIIDVDAAVATLLS
ncbi:MAG: hypothetical protein JWR63_3921 [Conexibacter sp.]|nr:hypothetical protein [Conexibacter sp.]